MWSFLSVVHPLQIPIPMCKKKIHVQQKKLYNITYCLPYHQPNSCNTHAEHEWAQGTFLSKTAEKSSSSPRATGVH
jgi:hypothetical protein